MILDVLNIALRAGKEIMEVYSRDLAVEYKEDRTPLTEADRRAHRVITDGLRGLDPDIPILSEEGGEVPYEERRGWTRFWLVDPLDGTKEFIRRNGEFTVNIALVEGERPALGVVYAPALKLLYFAQSGRGAYRMEVGKDRLTEEDLSTARKLSLFKERDPEKLIRVVASRSHMNRETEAFIKKLRRSTERVEITSIGSSLKICLVAEGKADIYPRLGPTMEWDTAAAHAVALESGCEIYTCGNSYTDILTYNKKTMLNQHFIVLCKEVISLLERVINNNLS